MVKSVHENAVVPDMKHRLAFSMHAGLVVVAFFSEDFFEKQI